MHGGSIIDSERRNVKRCEHRPKPKEAPRTTHPVPPFVLDAAILSPGWQYWFFLCETPA